jgi:hypothetical protein
MAHTPGPWAYDGDSQEVYGTAEKYGSGWIARVVGNDSDGRPFPDEERLANARLIAAAPELLAALKMWMELETTCDGRRPCYCDDPEISQHGKCYACVATDAIARAEGITKKDEHDPQN